MASRITGKTLSLKEFLNRQRVLSLYHEILRTIYKIQDGNDRKYMLAWAREEFDKNKSETDPETITQMIMRGKLTLREMSAAINLSK